MGKTESGAIWLDAERTSPYEFYQYWRNVDDADVMRCLAYLTEIEQHEYDSLAEQTASDPSRRAAQNWLAEWMTQFVHGDEALQKAKHASASLFGGGIKDASGAMAIEMLADVPSTEMESATLTGEGLWIVDALQSAGLCQSGGEARRTIKEGGCYVNDERITDVQHRLSQDNLSNDSVIVMRRGKKKYALLRFK